MRQKFELQKGAVSERLNKYNLTAVEEEKIEITGNQMPPVGLYGYCQRDKRTIHFSGFGSRDKSGTAINGRVGNHLGEKTLEEGQVAAKGACLNFLNNLATVCDGDLDGVKSIALRVDINCDPEFKDLPKVANGASNLLINVFGKYSGMPIRTASGSSSLPNGMMVEVTGMVLITKELAEKLDVKEAKNLVGILSLVNDLINPEIDLHSDIIEALSSSKKLTKKLVFLLQNYVTNTCDQLEKLTIEIAPEEWTSNAKNNGFVEKIESKIDLIDFLSSKAKNLNLTLTEEKLSKYSSLYGTNTRKLKTEAAHINVSPDSNIKTGLF